MKRLACAVLVLLAGALALAAAEPPVRLRIVKPAAGQPVFGDVEVEVAVEPPGAAVAKVEIYLDGKRVGAADAPPYRALVNAGQDNVEHHFEAIAYGAKGPIATTEARTPSIATDLEVKVELHQSFVTVEKGGVPVKDLTKEDFDLYDDGVHQTIVSFERGDVPFNAALLLDASTSMKGGRLQTALDGAKAFAGAISPQDQVKLILFSDQVRVETPFTSIPSVLTLSLGDAKAGGGTALNDCFYLALKRLETRRGRKVAVLLSDGIDVESVLPMERLRKLARLHSVTLYWLRMRDPGDDDSVPVRHFTSWRNGSAHKVELEALRHIVDESGGRIIPLDRIEHVHATLTNLLGELRNQYVLGYYPGAARGSGKWHKVRIQVKGGGTVRAHEGYPEP